MDCRLICSVFLIACALFAVVTARANPEYLDRERHQQLKGWFELERDIGADELSRVKRGYGYGNNYLTNSYGDSGYKKGSSAFERVGEGKRLRCKALTKTASNEWCSENCVRGYCPKETCMCYGAGTYNAYTAKNQYNGDNGQHKSEYYN